MKPQEFDFDDVDREMLRVLDEYRSYRFAAGPITLSEGYLQLIANEERHPDNQTGADKSWVQRGRAAFRRVHRSVG